MSSVIPDSSYWISILRHVMTLVFHNKGFHKQMPRQSLETKFQSTLGLAHLAPDQRKSTLSAMGQTLSELKGLLGLESIDQVRRRLAPLRPWFDAYIERGPDNQVLVNDSGIQILQRYIALEQQGQTLNQAALEIKRELSEVLSAQPRQTSAEPLQHSRDHERSDEFVKELRARIESLERDKAYLQTKLDEALAKVPALPPPGQQQKSWWARLWGQ